MAREISRPATVAGGGKRRWRRVDERKGQVLAERRQERDAGGDPGRPPLTSVAIEHSAIVLEAQRRGSTPTFDLSLGLVFGPSIQQQLWSILS